MVFFFFYFTGTCEENYCLINLISMYFQYIIDLIYITFKSLARFYMKFSIRISFRNTKNNELVNLGFNCDMISGLQVLS